jgi:hypothetical protein
MYNVANEDQDFATGTCGGEFHPEFGPREGDVIVLALGTKRLCQYRS